MNLRQHVGERIRHLREAKGWTQSDMGAQPYISDVEKGRKSLTLDQVTHFASTFGVEPLELFNGALYAELFTERQRNEDLRRALSDLRKEVRTKYGKQRIENALRESEG